VRLSAQSAVAEDTMVVADTAAAMAVAAMAVAGVIADRNQQQCLAETYGARLK
jgi:hypothetical protein